MADDGPSPGKAGTGGADRPEADPDALARALDGAVAQLRAIALHLQQLLDVRVERARVGLRDGAFRVGQWALAGLVLFAVGIAAGLYLLRGLAGLLTQLLGERSWAGDLAAGVLVLFAAWAGGAAVRSRIRRRNLRRIQRKFTAEGRRPPIARKDLAT